MTELGGDFARSALPIAAGSRVSIPKGLFAAAFNILWFTVSVALVLGVGAYAIHRGWNW